MVLVDTPPVLATSDAVLVAKKVDGSLVVAGLGRVRRPQFLLALEQLLQVDARVLGLVVNRAEDADAPVTAPARVVTAGRFAAPAVQRNTATPR